MAAVNPAEFHSQVKELNDKPVRFFQFIDDEGTYSTDSMLGLLNLENRKIKVTKEGSSKKKNLSKEEVLQLKDEDEVSVRWPIKICDKVYDYPAKVMPNMILKNTNFDLADHAALLSKQLGLDEGYSEKLRHWSKAENIDRFRQAYSSHINPRHIGSDHEEDSLNEEYEFKSYQDLLKQRENDDQINKCKKLLIEMGHPNPESASLSSYLTDGTDDENNQKMDELRQRISDEKHVESIDIKCLSGCGNNNLK